MKSLRVTIGLLVLLIVTSCGVPQSEYDKLQSENESLIAELDECQNGADKIIARVKKAYDEKDYSEAKENINKLYERHPESPMNEEFKNLLAVIEKEEIKEQKRKEAARKERIRLENLNNTGMWSVLYYVDEFGEPTQNGYIRNTSYIGGTFSNTATQNSDLNVRFLISNASDISIQLYEYGGNNPVKAYSSERYRILIQDKDGKRYTLGATNYSDRLSFDNEASRQVHSILMKGGTIKFRIYESDTPTTEYDFTIPKADWYENAFKKLQES